MLDQLPSQEIILRFGINAVAMTALIFGLWASCSHARAW